MNKNKIGKDDKGEVSPIIGVTLMVATTIILAAIIATFVFYTMPTEVNNTNAEEIPRIIKSLESSGLDMQKVQCSAEINEAYPEATCWRGCQNNKTITVIIS